MQKDISRNQLDEIEWIEMRIKDIQSLHKMYDSLSDRSKQFFPTSILGHRSLGIHWSIGQIILIFSTISFTRMILKRIKGEYAYKILLAKNDNNIVGFAYLVGPVDMDKFYLGVCVLDSYHRQGIGTKLIKIITNLAKEEDIKVINLIANENNTNAISLYEKLGFVQVDKFPEKKQVTMEKMI
jgi:RimJ/RimL family protein N-acetyltransferase